MNNLSHEKALALREEILKLHKNDWESIYKCILVVNDEHVTVNKNGVYFCVKSLSEKSINDLEKYINHKKSILDHID